LRFKIPLPPEYDLLLFLPPMPGSRVVVVFARLNCPIIGDDDEVFN
jgi:hypothetical protein